VIDRTDAPLVVVLGVSGSGKTTVGTLVAEELEVPFVDADDLHPASNVAKMAAGIPLDDDDRWPWLARVGEELSTARRTGSGLVIACSALKRSYRDRIRSLAPQTVFVHLDGERDVIAQRMAARCDHFMPASLLDSQLATLERLSTGESGLVVDIARPVAQVVGDVARRIRKRVAS